MAHGIDALPEQEMPQPGISPLGHIVQFGYDPTPPGTCSMGHTECVYAQRLGYLTPEELEAMDLIGTFAGKLRKIIGDGPCAKGDWAEAADKIHQLQTVIMAQAAVRAYPEMFRPLGGRAE